MGWMDGWMVDRWTDGLMAYAVEERKPPEGLQKKRFVTRKRETESAVEEGY